MTTLDNLAKLGITIATGTFMVAGIVAAKVGHAFYSISQLPTAAQFGAKCLSTLAEGGALIGGSVGVALATDLIFGALVNEILKRRNLTNNTSAQAAGYAFKRAVTIVAVVGFTLIMGASPIVPIAGLVSLLVADILGLIKDTAVKAYKNNKLLKEREKLKEQENVVKLQDLSNQLWTAYDLTENEENTTKVNNLVKEVMEAKKLSKDTKTILDEKLASGNSDEKTKAEFLIQLTTPSKEEQPKIGEENKVEDIIENTNGDKKAFVGIDLSEYDTTPLTGQNFDLDVINEAYCRVDGNTVIITHDKDGTKLDKEIVLNKKNK